MTENEKRILFGVYREFRTVGKKVSFEVRELDWLCQNSLAAASGWRKESGDFNATEADSNAHALDILKDGGELKGKIIEALSYLEGKKYIEYRDLDRKPDRFEISVTVTGCEVARELESVWGRINYWYKSSKDSIWWFLISILITVLTAIVVSYFTTRITEKSKNETMNKGIQVDAAAHRD